MMAPAAQDAFHPGDLAGFQGDRPAGLIPLTRNEVARLATALTFPPARDARHRLRWSLWRRRHQHTAQACHYRRQAAHGP